MEDKETCTTELFLAKDGSVTVSETNGPPPIQSSGQWKVIPNSNDIGNDKFEMNIVRTYGSGLSSSDVGEFTFDVERTFIGDMSVVGGLVSVEGSMHMMVSGSFCLRVKRV
jgi:hypothetical protein